MRIWKALCLLARPWRFFAYLRLRRERNRLFSTLWRVTHLESVQRLHDKIRQVEHQMRML